AVLDGLDAGQSSAAHPFPGGGVSGHGTAGGAGRLDNHLELLQRERGSGFLAGTPAKVGVDLDPVGAVADLVADHAAQRLDAVGLLGALRNREAGSEAPGSVAASGDDGARDDEQARAGDDVLVDGLLQADVGVAGSLRAEVAESGEAGQQTVASMVGGASDA